MNAKDQITGSAYGNSLASQFTYNHGHVTGIQMGNIQHLQYEWDFTTGNLQWRKDAIRDMTETFSYDNLDRLTEISFGSITHRYDYQPNGNITASTSAGSYTYSQDKPHAVTLVTNPAAVADTTAQELEYTSFNKVKKIIQGAKELDIYYGANRQRIKTEYQDTACQLTKYFAHGNYEREMGDNNRELHYIFAGTGIAAIMQRCSSVDSMFYVHPDHLGSLVLITDENGDVYEEKSFDAFGRLRDPADWSIMVTEGNYRFDRGFTGHEHLEAFGLINMNGRMFDSHTARFLSPDLFVQDPFFTQSFNRYSYCMNNPLRFVDPDGYLFKGLWNWFRNLLRKKDHEDGRGGGIPSGPSGNDAPGGNAGPGGVGGGNTGPGGGVDGGNTDTGDVNKNSFWQWLKRVFGGNGEVYNVTFRYNPYTGETTSYTYYNVGNTAYCRTEVVNKPWISPQSYYNMMNTIYKIDKFWYGRTYSTNDPSNRAAEIVLEAVSKGLPTSNILMDANSIIMGSDPITGQILEGEERFIQPGFNILMNIIPGVPFDLKITWSILDITGIPSQNSPPPKH